MTGAIVEGLLNRCRAVKWRVNTRRWRSPLRRGRSHHGGLSHQGSAPVPASFPSAVFAPTSVKRAMMLPLRRHNVFTVLLECRCHLALLFPSVPRHFSQSFHCRNAQLLGYGLPNFLVSAAGRVDLEVATSLSWSLHSSERSTQRAQEICWHVTLFPSPLSATPL